MSCIWTVHRAGSTNMRGAILWTTCLRTQTRFQNATSGSSTTPGNTTRLQMTPSKVGETSRVLICRHPRPHCRPFHHRLYSHRSRHRLRLCRHRLVDTLGETSAWIGISCDHYTNVPQYLSGGNAWTNILNLSNFERSPSFAIERSWIDCTSSRSSRCCQNANYLVRFVSYCNFYLRRFRVESMCLCKL